MSATRRVACSPRSRNVVPPGHRQRLHAGSREGPSTIAGTRADSKESTDLGAQGTTSTKRWRGTVERFTYRDADSGFAVVRFQPSDPPLPSIGAVGTLAHLVEGQQVTLTGKEVEDRRFGRQIRVDAVEVATPTTVEGIRAYLSSKLVKGVGPATADRILAHFGARTLEVIECEPERLAEVEGLGAKRIEQLTEAIRSQRDVQDVMVFLQGHGLGPALATRIVKRLGAGAASRIQADPYRLVDDVIGVGFQTADRLARSLGIDAEAPSRLRAGLEFLLAQAATRDGHCFLPRDDLVQSTATLLQTNSETVAAALDELLTKRRVLAEPADTVATESDPIYPLRLHQAECGVAGLLDDLLDRGRKHPLPVKPDGAVEWFSERAGFALPEGQQRALQTALTSPVTVVTGGPGVGKTTIVRGLVEILGAKGLRVALAAPTGRAAKRMEESTGLSARTIHRLLEFHPGTGRFQRIEDAPIEADMVVVDETSMLDVQLAHDLMRAIDSRTKLVFVGDVDQLPAVGPGQVLHDLIESRRLPVVRLTEVFRQVGGETSGIVRAAHSILDGKVPDSGADSDSDFFYVETPDSLTTRQAIETMLTQRIPKAFGMDPVRDVQVLCPMYRGEAGADTLNSRLQNLLNPDQLELERAGKHFRVGDKVMQVRNDYDLDVHNGDTGFIVRIDKVLGSLEVDFSGRRVEYAAGDIDQLVPAYAITVHRAQGSEYPAVVIPLVGEHFLMLRRALLYTALTRGKRLVVLVGTRNALERAVASADEQRRNTGLASRLRRLATL